MDTMAERLAYALRVRKMKPMDLKRSTGLSKAAIYFLLDGTTKPEKVRDATVQLVCNVLRINRDWLLSGRGPMDSSRNGTLQANPVNDLDDVREAQLLMAKALAESIPTVGTAFVNDLERLPEHLLQRDHFSLLIATVRRELAKRDAASLLAQARKARGRNRP